MPFSSELRVVLPLIVLPLKLLQKKETFKTGLRNDAFCETVCGNFPVFQSQYLAGFFCKKIWHCFFLHVLFLCVLGSQGRFPKRFFVAVQSGNYDGPFFFIVARFSSASPNLMVQEPPPST